MRHGSPSAKWTDTGSHTRTRLLPMKAPVGGRRSPRPSRTNFGLPCPIKGCGCLRYDRNSLPKNRRLGYAHVSTYGQTLDIQLEHLRGAGCTKIYREKVTGAYSDRRELLKMLDA